MADIVTPQKRSAMMSGIRGKDTKLEMILRRGLHRDGYRFRLHVRDLPGRPDIVLPKYDAVIQAHGCFWHGHDCELSKIPESNHDWWEAKINRTRDRDAENRELTIAQGLRILEVWECSVRGPGRIGIESTLEIASKWIQSDRVSGIIQGSREL